MATTRLFILLVAFIGTMAHNEKDAEVQEFVNGNHKFTAAVYKELTKTESGNLLVSPLSAEIVLALTQEGTKGETSQELQRGLSLPTTQDKTQSAIKYLLANLIKSEDDAKLLAANKVYIADGYIIKDDFKKVAIDVYKSDVQSVDFGEKVKTAGIINKWVEDNTNKKIRDLIAADSLSTDVRVVLVNALYFSGKWTNPFESYMTRKEKFYKNEKDSVDVDMMHVTESFNYYEDAALDAKFLEMQYLGGDVSMTIVLPNSKGGLAALESKIDQVFQRPNYTFERVSVALPRFTIETDIKFVPILKNLGIQKAFDPTQADLSGINGEKTLYISDVVQKAFINVTETGTEAAAATAGLVSGDSGPLPAKSTFQADHPYLYYIKSKSVVLFVGRFKSL